MFSEERARIALAGLLALCALATGVLIGRATSSPSPGVPAATTIVHGVPVGVQDSAAGALAAADNYLAIASQTVEQNPGEFAALVNTVYTPPSRASTLAQASRARVADVADMSNYARGGRAVAVIAARRLDHYSPDAYPVCSKWGQAARLAARWVIVW